MATLRAARWLAADRVALDPARIRRRHQLAGGRILAHDAESTERPGAFEGEVVAAVPQVLRDRRIDPVLYRKQPGSGVMRKEGTREMAAVKHGRIDRFLQVQGQVD